MIGLEVEGVETVLRSAEVSAEEYSVVGSAWTDLKGDSLDLTGGGGPEGLKIRHPRPTAYIRSILHDSFPQRRSSVECRHQCIVIRSVDTAARMPYLKDQLFHPLFQPWKSGG